MQESKTQAHSSGTSKRGAANQKEVGLKEELKQLPSDTGLTKGQQISIILNSISCKAKKNKAGNNLNKPTLNISEKNLLLLIPPHLFGIC